jgi:hypothetical protein
MTTIGIFLIMAILIYFRRGHKHLKEIGIMHLTNFLRLSCFGHENEVTA